MSPQGRRSYRRLFEEVDPSDIAVRTTLDQMLAEDVTVYWRVDTGTRVQPVRSGPNASDTWESSRLLLEVEYFGLSVESVRRLRDAKIARQGTGAGGFRYPEPLLLALLDSEDREWRPAINDDWSATGEVFPLPQLFELFVVDTQHAHGSEIRRRTAPEHYQQLILDALKKLGYTPTALPCFQAGKPSEPKQRVKSMLLSQCLITHQPFQKAWGCLTRDGLIRYLP